MNLTMRFVTLSVAVLLAATGLSCATGDAPADPVAQFVRKELHLDLSRFPFGASRTNFPDLLPPGSNEVASGWQRLGMTAPLQSSATNFLDLRFDADRLVELRMMVVGSWATTNDNVRLLAEFKKLGAKRTGAHRFDLETKERRMSAEGFCTDENPGLLQFHITPPPQRRITP